MENFKNKFESKEYMSSDKINRFITNSSQESKCVELSNRLINILNNPNCYVVDLPIFKIDGWICSVDELDIPMIEKALKNNVDVYLCRFDLYDPNTIKGVLRDKNFELKRKIQSESTIEKYVRYLQSELGDKPYLTYENWKNLIKELTTF